MRSLGLKLLVILLLGILVLIRTLHFFLFGGSSNDNVDKRYNYNVSSTNNSRQSNGNNNGDQLAVGLEQRIAGEYRKEFPFTMRSSPACAAVLNNNTASASSSLLILARVAIDDWENNGGWDQNHSVPHDDFAYTTVGGSSSEETILSVEMQRAEATWRNMMEACHGPLHHHHQVVENSNGQSVSYSYTTLQDFTLGLARCAHPHIHNWGGGQHSVLSGNWCVNGFQKYANRAFRRHLEWKDVKDFLNDPRRDYLDGKIEAFVKTARCALKFEFPLVASRKSPLEDREQPSHQELQSTIHNSSHGNYGNTKSDGSAILLTNRQRNPNWKPQRVIILSPAMGRKGGPGMACRLVSTAVPRGWEVVLVEGKFRGLRYKYSDAMNALKLFLGKSSALTDSSSSKAEDTLVVFADSLDMLVQRSPESVIEAYLEMTAQFSFSAEPACFPMAFWPHSLGHSRQRCEESFPFTKEGHYKMGNKYANTGGWIGTASAALVVLDELSTLVKEEERDRRCHDHGTDQLLGNVAYLRHPTLIGLDYNYDIFASDAWHLIGKGDPLQLGSSPYPELDSGNLLYRYAPATIIEREDDDDKEKVLSPPFLHFNGGGSSGGMLDEGHTVLISNASLKKCRKDGKVTIVRVDEKSLRSEDFFEDKRWSSCRADNFCTKR